MKLGRKVFLLLLAAAVVYVGYTLWMQARYAPSVDDVEKAVTASLRQQVPVEIIQVPAGRHVEGGHQGQADSINVNKIGRKDVNESGREFWLVNVTVQGTCAVSSLERDRCGFAGKVWYRMYRTAATGRQLDMNQPAWQAVLEKAAPFGTGRPRVY